MPQKATIDKAQKQSIAARFRQQYEAANQTEQWTGPSGITVTVKRPDLESRAALDLLPAHCQQAVLQSLELTLNPDRTVKDPIADVLAGKASAVETVKALGMDLRDLMQMSEDVADAYVLAGWVEPRVVPTSADVTDEDNQIPLAWVSSADRYAFRDWCQAAEQEEAAVPATFPAGQAGDVGALPGREDLRAAAERADVPVAEPAGAAGL